MHQVVTPAEINRLLDQILAEVRQQAIAPAELAALERALAAFAERWQATFARFGQQPAGELAYRDALLVFQEDAAPLLRPWLTSESHGHAALTAIEAMQMPTPAPPRRFNRQLLAQMRQQRRVSSQPAEALPCPEFDRPVFIVSAPRAGSTLLFETLSHFPDVWTIGRESHDLEADIPALHPATRQYASNRLTAADATPAICQAVRHWFGQRLQNRAGQSYAAVPAEQRPAAVRFLEKTPKNALRIPFLKAVFPEARFLFLYREPRQNISSLLEGWRSRRFVAYREMPGWPYQEWSFLLIPGWEKLIDRPLVEIAAQQWRVANEYIQADVQALPRGDWLLVTYEDITRQPAETMQKISQFASLRWDESVQQAVSGDLPLSQMVISPPVPDKWRKHEAEIAPLLSELEPVANRIAGY
jgi:hypothetical protein